MPVTHIINTMTGCVQLRHYATATIARCELEQEVGRRLVWMRTELEWVAIAGDMEYRVEIIVAQG